MNMEVHYFTLPIRYNSNKQAVQAQEVGMLLDADGDGVMNALNNDGKTPLPDLCSALSSIAWLT
jgi:hypothetical protein